MIKEQKCTLFRSLLTFFLNSSILHSESVSDLSPVHALSKKQCQSLDGKM